MTCSIFPFHLECSFRYSPSISDEKQQLKITIQLNINDHLDEWEKSDNKNEFQWIIVILSLSQHQNEKEKEILVSITYMNRSCQIFIGQKKKIIQWKVISELRSSNSMIKFGKFQ